ncbi:adrA protein [Salmonella enterica subsp. arizonae]|nr:adrA protein [Salmonella enterica subsp. arizonae]
MNDENFYRKALEEAVAPADPPDDHQRFGLRFARRIRLPRAVGLGGMFLPVAAVLVSQHVSGGWWLLLVGWSFVWPHLAWQWAMKAPDPLQQEIYNLKADVILTGMWIALIGVNMLPAAALFRMMSMNLIGAGGLRLFFAGREAFSGVMSGDVTAYRATHRYAKLVAGSHALFACYCAVSAPVCLSKLSDSH